VDGFPSCDFVSFLVQDPQTALLPTATRCTTLLTVWPVTPAGLPLAL